MSLLLRPKRTRLIVPLLTALAVAWLLAACGGGDEGVEASDLFDLSGEAGEGSVFWRTADQFQSLKADEPYKVVVRVTGGFAEEQLRIVAEREEGKELVEFEATRAVPVGGEAPGSYYVFALELSEPGPWQVTAFAGEEAATIGVEAGARDPSTRY